MTIGYKSTRVTTFQKSEAMASKSLEYRGHVNLATEIVYLRNSLLNASANMDASANGFIGV